MGGVWHHPHLVKPPSRTKPVAWRLNPDNVKAVVDGMYGVVNEGGGRASAPIPDIEVCGKTGTAQLASDDFARATGHDSG